MTVVSKTADLTRAINDTVKELQVTQASLDAQVTTAEAYATTAATHRTTAEGYRDTASTHAADAATHLATVQAGVTYQGIGAILDSKAVTAVDVFVYDTSLDSDGGAWRKRCQHTSWYNETLNTATRGARREFPAVAVIVAEATKVTIYDGDDPALPMWRVIFSGTSDDAVKAVAAKNAIVVVGNQHASLVYGGTIEFRFVDDKAFYRRAVSNYNNAAIPMFSNTYYGGYFPGPLINQAVNDVAMTVLPNAPVDPATGLPVPTIAVATNGGVSVIKDDGTVVSTQMSTNQGGYLTKVSIFGTKVATSGIGTTAYWGQDVWDFATGQKFLMGTAWPGSLGLGANSNVEQVGFTNDESKYVGRYWPGGQGLGIINWGDFGKSLALGRSSKYVTGWMPGAIKGAFLADTDDNNLVEQASIIPNGDFSSEDSFWVSPTGSATKQIVNGQLEIAAATDFAGFYSNGSTAYEAGWYWVEADLISGTGRFDFQFVGNAGDFPNVNRTGPYSYRGYVMLREPDGYFKPGLRTSVAGTTTVWDNLRMVKVDDDRSVNSKGLLVNGTITRSPVADGAELVAYSGFRSVAGSERYLYQPYNPALDFGTGDFSIMFWVNDPGGASTSAVLQRQGLGGADVGLYVWRFTSSSSRALVLTVGNSGVTAAKATPIGVYTHVAMLRRNGELSIYLDGALSAGGVSNNYNVVSDQPLYFGVTSAIGSGNEAIRYALLRISATAPTPDQIKKIYEDERKLFQPGAQCTLYGTSDAVTALAHDPKTNLLHVGTAQGRSVFDGLVRVANTTTAVGTAISAVNGLIVEE